MPVEDGLVAAAAR